LTICSLVDNANSSSSIWIELLSRKLEIEKSINRISSLSRNGDKLVYVVKEFREDERMVIRTEIYSQ